MRLVVKFKLIEFCVWMGMFKIGLTFEIAFFYLQRNNFFWKQSQNIRLGTFGMFHWFYLFIHFVFINALDVNDFRDGLELRWAEGIGLTWHGIA